MIEKMSADLLKEQQEEIDHRDFCISEFKDNAFETERTEIRRDHLKSKSADLATDIEALTSAIDTLKAELSELQLQLKHGAQDRELQNKEFLQVVADQRATQKLLQKALSVLEGFYKKAAFVQGQQAPPPGFYKKAAFVQGQQAPP